jgi:lipopolysaccharide transport system ATP-binding protein
MESTIIVEKLSKKYDIGKLKKDTQFREALINFMKRTIFRKNGNKEEIWALKDVSFSAHYGEIIGVIGPNGAGKSTLLKILSKITYPTSGRIKVLGRVASLLEIGTGFHEELTGRENIFLNGSILGMKKKEVKAKLDQIIDFSGVEKFLDTPIKRYSSGMRVRLGFAVAAHLDTDILFVDEVLAVGDVAFQKKCLNAMEDMRSGGRTVIFVSHNMKAIEGLCHRVIWIDNGEIREDGNSSDVIKNYVSEYAGVIQSSGMDLTNFPHRTGTGDIQYTGIEFLNPDGEPKELISSGDSLRVRLHYRVYKPVSKPDFYVRIFTDLGGKVATLSSYLSGHEIPMLYPGTGYVDVDVDFLNLMPDRYYLTPYINSRDTPDKKPLNHDSCDRCAEIEVKVYDYYRSGRGGIDKFWGVIFLPCKWNFEGLHDREDSAENM